MFTLSLYPLATLLPQEDIAIFKQHSRLTMQYAKFANLSNRNP